MANVTSRRRRWAAERGQGLVELTLALVFLAGFLLALVDVGRVVQADAALGEVTHSAVRLAATAPTAAAADTVARATAVAIARATHLDPGRLTLAVDTAQFRRGGTVSVVARYDLRLPPLVGLPLGRLTLQDQEVAPVDRYRPFPAGGGA